MDTVVLNCVTQFNIVWSVGTFPFLPISKMSSKNTLRYSRGIIVFKNRFHSKRSMIFRPTLHDDCKRSMIFRPTLHDDCKRSMIFRPTLHDDWRRLQTALSSDVFYRAPNKDVGMALNLNRLIVSAPLCISDCDTWWLACTEQRPAVWQIVATDILLTE